MGLDTGSVIGNGTNKGGRMIDDGRGQNMKIEAEKNYQRILAWAKSNPKRTKTDCSIELGLNFRTVSKHIKSAYRLKDLV